MKFNEIRYVKKYIFRIFYGLDLICRSWFNYFAACEQLKVELAIERQAPILFSCVCIKLPSLLMGTIIMHLFEVMGMFHGKFGFLCKIWLLVNPLFVIAF